MKEEGKMQNITKFLLQSVKFYENVDEYAGLLNLDTEELLLFKNDVRIFLFVAERYQSFTRSFVLYNIDVMRKRFTYLSGICTRSRNYTKSIGAKLGIDEPPRDTRFYFVNSLGFTPKTWLLKNQ